MPRVAQAGLFPQWRELPVTQIASQGTVNAIFRIGNHLAARFPLEPGEPDRIRCWLNTEAEAARELSGSTRFPTPEPVALGEPGPGYPLPWSVQTWLPGITAIDDDPHGSIPFAYDLAEFIGGVRALDIRGRTFSGKGRGGDLRTHDVWMTTCFEQSEHLLDVPRLRRLWAALRDLPRADPDRMTHGDLIPGNILVAQGRLAVASTAHGASSAPHAHTSFFRSLAQADDARSAAASMFWRAVARPSGRSPRW